MASPQTDPVRGEWRLPSDTVLPRIKTIGVDISAQEVTLVTLSSHDGRMLLLNHHAIRPSEWRTSFYPFDNDASRRTFMMLERLEGWLQREHRQIPFNGRVFLACEEASHPRNMVTNRRLIGVHQAVASAAFHAGVPFLSVNNSLWKGHLGVKGVKRADQKKSVVTQLRARGWETEALSQDGCDALGVALYLREVLMRQRVLSRCPFCEAVYYSDLATLSCIERDHDKSVTLPMIMKGLGLPSGPAQALYDAHYAARPQLRGRNRRTVSPGVVAEELVFEHHDWRFDLDDNSRNAAGTA